MDEINWTSYIPTVSGIVGAITGIAGAIMGFLGYRRSTQIKALDLRLELRKADNEVIASIERLGELLPYADRSRRAVAAATGGLNSGAMELWKQSFEADAATLAELQRSQPASDATYPGLSPEELESKLVQVHRLQGRADAIRDKYEGALQQDDEQRRQRREDFRDMQNRGRS